MRRKTAVLYIQPNAKLGGSFQSLYYLLKNLDQSKYEPTVLLPKYNQLIAKKLKSVNAKVLVSLFPRIAISVNFKYRILITSLIRYVLCKRYYLKQMSPISSDIIHLNSLNSAFGVLLAEKNGIPLVWHVREQIPPVFGGLVQKFFDSLFRNDAVKQIICISENERHHLPQHKAHIIHNFFQLNGQPIPPGTPTKFLSIGSFTYDKGFWLLIDAVRYLREHNTPSDFKVALMGIAQKSTIVKKILKEKTIEHFKTEIKKHRITDFFEFHHQRDEIRPEFLAQFHVLIRPSLHSDPWGRDIIEAMSVGRPLIATGKYAKFVRPEVNGYLVPSAEPVELAKKMQLFINDQERVHAFGQKSLEIAEELFNPRKNTRQVELIYENLIGNFR